NPRSRRDEVIDFAGSRAIRAYRRKTERRIQKIPGIGKISACINPEDGAVVRNTELLGHTSEFLDKIDTKEAIEQFVRHTPEGGARNGTAGIEESGIAGTRRRINEARAMMAIIDGPVQDGLAHIAAGKTCIHQDGIEHVKIARSAVDRTHQLLGFALDDEGHFPGTVDLILPHDGGSRDPEAANDKANDGKDDSRLNQTEPAKECFFHRMSA